MKIIKAARQVVAGLNYFLRLQGRVGKLLITVDATVFRSLSGEYSVVDLSVQKDTITKERFLNL
jgi:hypothetical protein